MFPGQLFDDRYLLEDEAGSGGMGTVWRALDTRIQRTVAIKVLHSHLAKDAQLRARFDREARVIGGLHHPGVVHLYDFTETTIGGNPVAYLVMEFVPGSSLQALLAEHRRLSVEQTLRLVALAAEGLHCAHQRGIVHRDIKPGNILVSEDSVKIVDFGISQSHGDQKLTATGHIMGSLHYVSPEQLQGKQLTQVSDVYSLGVVAYEALTGEHPFPGDTPAAVLTGHLQHEPRPLPPEVPDTAGNVIMRALAKKPEDRFESAAALALACHAARDDDDADATFPIPAAPPVSPTTSYPLSEPVPDKPPRRRLLVASVIALVVVLAAATGLAVWSLTGSSEPGGKTDSAGPTELHAFEQVGEPVPFSGAGDSDRGTVPEPVTNGNAAFFVDDADSGPELIAVDLATGKEDWRQPMAEPIGLAIRAGKNVLYTADTETGVINFLDAETGESQNVVDLAGPISVTTVNDSVVALADDARFVIAYHSDGTRAWRSEVNPSVIDLDVEAQWKDFTNQPGRFSPQEPENLILYFEDGTLRRFDAETGDELSSAKTGSDLSVTASFEGMVFNAAPRDDGAGYDLIMRDISDDFAEVGRWESLRPGHTPGDIEWCGKTRICVRDGDAGGVAGAIVIDFSDPGGRPLWQSSGDTAVGEVYVAGSTTAVVEAGAGISSTQLYDAEFEPLGRPKPGTFRPIDAKHFLDYPRTAGNAPNNAVAKHFFTGLDAADGSTRDLGTHEVFPQCVTDGVHIACPTPRGITVWLYGESS